MKIKKEYIILASIIVLISLYLLGRDTDRTRYQLPEIPEIDNDTISKIEINKAETSIVLKKKGDKWQILPEEYDADMEKVKDMLETIKGISLTAVVSESESYSRYDLDDENKITARAFSGDKMDLEVEIGKTASSYRHTFVKLTGDHRVYHAEGNFRHKFDQDVEAFRDNTVLSFDKSEIGEICLEKGNEKIVFAMEQIPVEVSAGEETDKQSSPSSQVEMTWKTADGKEGDEDQISRLLDILVSLKCEKYINGRKKEDFTKPISVLILKGAKDYTLSIFEKLDKDANNYPAVSSENDYPFLLPEWQVRSLTKKPEELVKQS